MYSPVFPESAHISQNPLTIAESGTTSCIRRLRNPLTISGIYFPLLFHRIRLQLRNPEQLAIRRLRNFQYIFLQFPEYSYIFNPLTPENIFRSYFTESAYTESAYSIAESGIRNNRSAIFAGCQNPLTRLLLFHPLTISGIYFYNFRNPLIFHRIRLQLRNPEQLAIFAGCGIHLQFPEYIFRSYFTESAYNCGIRNN